MANAIIFGIMQRNEKERMLTMKFFNKQLHESIYFSAYGKGRDSGIRIEFAETHTHRPSLLLEIDEAIVFQKYLSEAIEKAKERQKQSENDDEDDE